MVRAAGIDGPRLDPLGVPTVPVRLIDMDEWESAPSDRVAAEATSCAGRLQLCIGVSTEGLTDHTLVLAEALTVTLVPRGTEQGSEFCVGVDDPVAAAEALVTLVERRPQTALALGQLLRQTTALPTLAGLAAEAAVYSMLLGGSEFRAWLTEPRSLRTTPTGDQPTVAVERIDDRLVVALDRPERRNAMNARLREDLCEALLFPVLDDSIAEVEIRGNGPAFCSGGDLAEFGTATDLVAAFLVRLERAPWRLIAHISDRVHVRIHGAAVGAGVEMAAFAGHVTSTPEAFFVLPELSMGLVPGAGGTVSIPRRIGRSRAAWMMLTGERVDAATALEWGLIDAIEDR